MASKIDGITVEILADVKRYQADLRASTATTRAELAKTSSHYQRFSRDTTGQLTKVQASFKTTGVAAAALGAALRTLLPVLTIASLSRLVTSAFDSASALRAQAAEAGISAESLQRWIGAASDSGLEAGRMAEAISRLNRNLGEFQRTGAGRAAKAITELGLAADLASNKIGGTEEVLDAAIRRLAAIEDPARRASLAAELFGRTAGPAMAQFLQTGVAAIDQARQAINVLSDEMVNRAEEIQSRFSRMAQNLGVIFKGLAIQLFGAFLDPLPLPDLELDKTITEIGRLERALEAMRTAGVPEGSGQFATIKAELDEARAKADRLRESIKAAKAAFAAGAQTFELPEFEETPTAKITPIASGRDETSRRLFEQLSKSTEFIRTKRQEAADEFAALVEALKPPVEDFTAAMRTIQAASRLGIVDPVTAANAQDLAAQRQIAKNQEEANKRVLESYGQINEAARLFADTAAEAATAAITKAKTLGEAFQGLLDALIQATLQAVIFKGVMAAIGSAGGGGALGALFPGLASGGIVKKPGLFWIAEREPEVVIPLSKIENTQRRMGVEGLGSGGGPATTITNNIIAKDITPGSVATLFNMAVRAAPGAVVNAQARGLVRGQRPPW